MASNSTGKSDSDHGREDGSATSSVNGHNQGTEQTASVGSSIESNQSTAIDTGEDTDNTPGVATEQTPDTGPGPSIGSADQISQNANQQASEHFLVSSLFILKGKGKTR